MVAVDSGAIEVGRYICHQYRHCMSLSWNGRIVNLLYIVIITYSAKVKSAVLLANESPFSLRNGIHTGDGPQGEITPFGLIDVLHVDIGRETVDVLRIIALEIEYAIHHQRVKNLARNHCCHDYCHEKG